MYPQRELTRLNAYKVALQKDIERQRVQCAAVATRVAQPLELLDRILVLWRRISPFALFAALPLGIIAQRAVIPRVKILESLVRWSPLIFTVIHRISALVTKPSVASRNQR